MRRQRRDYIAIRNLLSVYSCKPHTHFTSQQRLSNLDWEIIFYTKVEMKGPSEVSLPVGVTHAHVVVVRVIDFAAIVSQDARYFWHCVTSVFLGINKLISIISHMRGGLNWQCCMESLLSLCSPESVVCTGLNRDCQCGNSQTLKHRCVHWVTKLHD